MGDMDIETGAKIYEKIFKLAKITFLVDKMRS